MASEVASALPKPFYDDWPSSGRSDVQVFWDWHMALSSAQPLTRNGTDPSHDGYFEAEHERALNGDPVHMLSESVWRPAYDASDRNDIPRDLLADQVLGAKYLHGTVRFETTAELDHFLTLWAVPLARQLARLAEADHSWQQRHVGELARGFFFVGRLLTLPDDLDRGRLFFPVADLEQADVSLEQLRSGSVDERVRRLLWKQTVRARDALAQGQPLIRELKRPYRMRLKWWWLWALEIISEIERNDYDLWSERIELGFFRRLQVQLQTWFGKATARPR